nr:hypothetical protein [uncultured Desulfobacter sp.]
MTRSKLLTIAALRDELNMGKATLKFILNRFGPWLTTQVVDDETCYTEQAVTTLLKIKKFLDAGMLPEQVEAFLAQEAEMLKATASVQPSADNQGTIPVDMESVSIFKDMFQVYIEKQDRIALAQEALARVEEKKADAMEKRAVAEEKKADAMTNIALALQEMNQRHSATPQAMEIAGRAVETLALEESAEIDESPLDTNFNENENLFEDPVPMDDEFKDQDHEDIGDMDSSNMDDLSLLVNETALTLEDIDDLSSLIDSVSEPDSDLGDLENLPEETQSAPEMNNLSDDMDDLSKLIDSDLSSPNSLDNKDDNKDINEDDLDDLFSLVDMDTDVPKDLNEDLDDLSKLIEPVGDERGGDLDDLSALLGEPTQSQEPIMDDLSLLVHGTGEESGPVPPGVDTQADDLWSLVSEAEGSNQEIQSPAEQLADAPGMDDLSALINKVPDNSQITTDTTPAYKNSIGAPTDSLKETPLIKLDVSPDQDMKKYKAAVMKILIELKEQGFTAQQTTDRFNRDGVATLSGKPAWGLKAIEKIYGFIDSAN